MAAQSFEDSLREIVKARLNPDTEELMKKKNAAQAQYYGADYAYGDTLGEVYDPADKRRLLDTHRQSLIANAGTYEDALTNRDLGIDKVVTAFGNARKEEMDREAQAQQLAMAEEELNLKKQELAISQQNANTSSSSSAKQDLTFQDRVNQLVAAGYTLDQAKAMATSAMTGSDLATSSAFLKPVVPPTTTTGKSFDWSGVKKYLGGMGSNLNKLSLTSLTKQAVDHYNATRK